MTWNWQRILKQSDDKYVEKVITQVYFKWWDKMMIHADVKNVMTQNDDT